MTHGSPTRAIRVLAADDSSTMRSLLKMLFQRHAEGTESPLPCMELCGSVGNGEDCLDAVAQLKPDVLLLDFEMPGLHGLGVLARLKTEAPRLPVIMCSAYTERGAQATLDALSLGAKDYVMKPSQQRDAAAAMAQLAQQLLPKIAALASPRKLVPGSILRAASAALPTAGDGGALRCPIVAPAQRIPSSPAMAGRGLRRQELSAVTAGTLQPVPQGYESLSRGGGPAHRIDIVVVGVSTGGPAALELMLPLLPADLAVPVLIVQHMPKLFTGALAERLDRLCGLRVVEACEGDRVGARGIWIAPGDEHMEVVRAAGARGTGFLHLHHGGALNSCRPSVDHLFRSAALGYGAGVLAIMLTGMGSDGFAGAVEVQKAGGTVLAQDEATSAVWGMPGKVSRAGIAAATLPLGAIAHELVRRVKAPDAVKPHSEGNRLTLEGRFDAGRMERRHGLL